MLKTILYLGPLINLERIGLGMKHKTTFNVSTFTVVLLLHLSLRAQPLLCNSLIPRVHSLHTGPLYPANCGDCIPLVGNCKSIRNSMASRLGNTIGATPPMVSIWVTGILTKNRSWAMPSMPMPLFKKIYCRIRADTV